MKNRFGTNRKFCKLVIPVCIGGIWICMSAVVLYKVITKVIIKNWAFDTIRIQPENIIKAANGFRTEVE